MQNLKCSLLLYGSEWGNIKCAISWKHIEMDIEMDHNLDLADKYFVGGRVHNVSLPVKCSWWVWGYSVHFGFSTTILIIKSEMDQILGLKGKYLVYARYLLRFKCLTWFWGHSAHFQFWQLKWLFLQLNWPTFGSPWQILYIQGTLGSKYLRATWGHSVRFQFSTATMYLENCYLYRVKGTKIWAWGVST